MEHLLKSLLDRYRQQIGLTLVSLILIGGGALIIARGSGSKDEIDIVKGSRTRASESTSAGEPIVNEPLIVVEVSGAVNNPGVYELTEGSRIAAALERAGGLADQADGDWVSKNLNQAAKLSDGDKIYIAMVGETEAPRTPTPVAAPSNQTTPSPAGMVSGSTVSCDKVNINSASAGTLDDCLPGIGPAYAQRIIEYRQAHGGFKTIEEIQEVRGIGPKTFEKLKGQITL